MAIEEAPGNSGGVQNIRLVIDIGDDRTVEIPLKGKLILQNSGPPQAAAGDAEQEEEKKKKKEKEKDDKEFLMHMRGWLMMVGTLFVTMAFQAALQPPAWLRTTDFLRLRQSDIDRLKHSWNPFYGASHAAAAAPARFVPSPSPSPQAAESATASPSRRARAYMGCNYITFGSSLALVLVLLWKIPPKRAERTMVVAACMMVLIALSAIGSIALGTSEDWRYILTAALLIAYCAALVATILLLLVISPPRSVSIAARLCLTLLQRALRCARR